MPKPIHQPFIIGGDLSSSKLAFVCRHSYKRNFKVAVYKLGTPYRPESCAKAMDATMAYLASLDGFIPPHVQRLAYLEAPIVGPGTKATIVQSFVSGVVQACLIKAGFTVYLVYPSTWKRVVCGNGRADKAAITSIVGQRWPEIIRSIGTDQDLADATGIYLYGRTVLEGRHQMDAKG